MSKRSLNGTGDVLVFDVVTAENALESYFKQRVGTLTEACPIRLHFILTLGVSLFFHSLPLLDPPPLEPAL